MRHLVNTLIILPLILSCKKKIEIREVEKKNSWAESKRFTGTEKIFLSSGSNGGTIFLQQPFFFTALINQNEFSGITVYGAGLPTNIDTRIPISSTFSAFAISDTVLRIINNTLPLVSPGGYINLKAVDPTLVAIQKTNPLLFKTMSINSNGVLLLTYSNNRASQPLTFMMLKVKTSSSHPYVDTLYSKVITVPKTSVNAYSRYFTAINDYFLADLSSNGIYKFNEDGSFVKVHNGAVVDAFYDWKGKVYAHAEWEKLLISSDNGSNWQEYSGITSSMVSSSYYKIKDSLIGTGRDIIFTLNWDNTNFSQRILKTDGLEGSKINGVEILKDTVYVATTKGLFFKPVTSFFESK